MPTQSGCKRVSSVYPEITVTPRSAPTSSASTLRRLTMSRRASTTDAYETSRIVSSMLGVAAGAQRLDSATQPANVTRPATKAQSSRRSGSVGTRIRRSVAAQSEMNASQAQESEK